MADASRREALREMIAVAGEGTGKDRGRAT
jgi:hypothetical protein